MAKKYFKCFYPGNVTTSGFIQRLDNSMAMAIDNAPSMEIPRPVNYAFHLRVMPQPTAQPVMMAVSSSAILTKAWGVAVGNYDECRDNPITHGNNCGEKLICKLFGGSRRIIHLLSILATSFPLLRPVVYFPVVWFFVE